MDGVAQFGGTDTTRKYSGTIWADCPIEAIRAGLVEGVLLHADEVGVTGPRPGERRAAPLRQRLEVDRFRAHHVDPARPLGVADAQRDRAAHAQAEAHTAGKGQFIGLELHPGATPEAQLAASEVGAHLVHGQRHSGGKSLQDRHQFRAVRFSCGQPSKHVSIFP